MKKNAKLMTTGSISKNIISFAIPLSLGNLFQQLYHTVDTIVVGNFVNKEALAAIASCGPLLYLLIGLFMGIFVGAGVVISKYFGKEEIHNVKLAIHTSVAFAIASSIVLTIVGLVLKDLKPAFLGSLCISLVCPPSKPVGILKPERDFCPLYPLPAVVPPFPALPLPRRVLFFLF